MLSLSLCLNSILSLPLIGSAREVSQPLGSRERGREAEHRRPRGRPLMSALIRLAPFTLQHSLTEQQKRRLENEEATAKRENKEREKETSLWGEHSGVANWLPWLLTVTPGQRAERVVKKAHCHCVVALPATADRPRRWALLMMRRRRRAKTFG